MTAATPEPVSDDEPATAEGKVEALYGVPFTAGVAIETLGAVVSTVIVVFASRLPPAPGVASASVASFPAASRIVPPFVVSALVPVYASGDALSEAPTV